MLFNELQEYDNLGRLAQKSFGGNSFGIKYAYENYEIAKARLPAAPLNTIYFGE